MKKYYFRHYTFLLILCAFALLPMVGYADGVVPRGCQAGCPCTLCDLYTLAQNIIHFLLFDLSIPIATLAFLYGGILMLTSGGSPDKISQGRKALGNAALGLAIAFFAWVVINTLLQTFVFSIPFKDAIIPWNEKPNCKSSDEGNRCRQASIMKSVPQLQLDLNYGTYVAGREVDYKKLDPTDPSYDPTLDQTWRDVEAETAQKIDFNKNTQDLINYYAGLYDISPADIKAIIAIESGGNINAFNPEADHRGAYGLMQIRPDTAKLFDPSLKGLSDSEIGERLRDPNLNIQLGALYYARALNENGGDKELAVAMYNGGPGANKPSIHCPGMRRWQCEYDNNAHTEPNKGYLPTRKYRDKFNALSASYANDPTP